MLRMHNSVIDRFYIYCAGVICFVGFLLAYFSLYELARVEFILTYVPAMLAFSAVLVIVMLSRRFSVSAPFSSYGYVLKEVLIAVFAGFFVYGFMDYSFKLKHISRLYILLSSAICFFSNLLWFSILLRFYKQGLQKSGVARNVMLVGNRYTIQEIMGMVQEKRLMGLNFVGILSTHPESFEGDVFMGCPIIKYDKNEDLDAFFNKHVVDYVFLTVYRQDPQFAEKVILTCQSRGIEVWLKPDFMHRAIQVSKADYLSTMPVFVFSMGPQASFALIFKRILDVISGLILLALCAIPMTVIAFLIKRESKGPAIFVQRRVGLNGRKFLFYKFRSMYQDSEQRREQYHQKNEMDGPVFKMTDDPRITRIGKIIRKYSLDELPQLWNVVKGDMSLVGPRPPLPTEVDLYSGWHRRRLSMRPGITCIWQVSGRNAISDFKEWVKLDLQYIDNWSLGLDFKILIKTFPAVVKGTGV